MRARIWIAVTLLVACGGGGANPDAGDDASQDGAAVDAPAEAAPLDATTDATTDAADASAGDAADEVVIDSGPQSEPWAVDQGVNDTQFVSALGIAADAKAGMVASIAGDEYGAYLAVWDASGNALWSQAASGGGMTSVAIAPSGDVYVAAYAGANTDFGAGPVGTAGPVVVKYDATGKLQWLDGPFQNGVNFFRLALKSNGNVVLLGQMTGSQDFGAGTVTSVGSYYDVLLVELTPAMSCVRALVWGDGGGNQYVPAMALDANDDLFFGGTLEGTIDFGGGPMTGPGDWAGTAAYIVELDSAGGYLHQVQLDPGTSSAQVGALAVDSKGEVGVCGSFTDTVTLGQKTLLSAGGSDVFAGILDASFGVKWNDRFGDAQNQTCAAAAFDAAGELVIGGLVMGNINFGLGYLSGQIGYVVRFDGAGVALAQGDATLPAAFAPFIAPDLVALLPATSGYIGNASYTNNQQPYKAPIVARFLPP